MPSESKWRQAASLAWQDVLAGIFEQAAILEHDNGLPRRDADAMAIGGYLDERYASGLRGAGILSELARADHSRLSPELAPVLTACGLLGARAPVYGFGHVVPDDGVYRPAMPDERDATAAVIVPITSMGEGLVDLVAQCLRSGRMIARLGVGDLVGLDEVDRARGCDTPLLIFNTTLDWLRGGCWGAVVVDWHDIGWRLEGVRTLLCRTTLAARLHQATRRCWPRPAIMAPSARKELRCAA
jgi:hypothetical protein